MAESTYDWDTLWAVFLAIFKAISPSSDAVPQTQRAAVATVTAVYAMADPTLSESVVSVLARRVSLSPARGVVSVKGNRVMVTIEGSGELEPILKRLAEPGRLSVRSGDEVILNPTDFETAKKVEFGIAVTLGKSASKKWAAVTTARVGETLTFMLDDRELVSPKIMEPITGGELVISGHNVGDEILLFINAGALPTDLELVEMR